MRIFERLRDEHDYAGGYDAVRRFVKKHRIDKRETFVPLDHDPGQRQCRRHRKNLGRPFRPMAG